jgi:hypothetical protein
MTPRKDSFINAQEILDIPTQPDSKTKGNLTNFPVQRKPEPNDPVKVQPPQGDLITDLSQKLSGKEQVFIDLPIKEIKHFNIIQDFNIPTRSMYPIVIVFKDSGHTHCVDGWNLVQEAEKKGENTIKCHVFYMDSFHVPAIVIFKTAMRSMPLGGTCTHAEMIQNIRICFQSIRGANKIPKASGHGGDRKSPEFSDKMEQKIIGLLVEHLGKPKRKILEYINHGAGLSDETLKFLVKKGTGRKFSEEVQKNKTNTIARLKQEGLSQETILKEISKRMQEWHKEYKETGEVESELNKTKLPPEEINKIPPQIAAPKKKEPEVHTHWTGNTSAQEDLPPTKDQIYAELGTIIEPFVALQEEKPDITEDLIQQILNASKQLVFLSESMTYLMEAAQPPSKLEVA